MGLLTLALAKLRGRGALIAAVSGWVLLIGMTSLYLNKRDDFSAEIERCRADKLQSLLDSDRVVRRAADRAAAANLADLDKMAAAVRAAEAQINEERLRNQEAALRFEALVNGVSNDEPQSCLNTPVDDRLVRVLRGADRRPPGARRNTPD